ncbi:hypothetical protein ACFWPX_33400 [Nocardia sp. NPDC058518]|uniref:hypothetical protein n=1 Tax=Nocardia sp. NPDC058518 TaxID=3346534 RepID=UPI00364DB774
MSFTLPLPGVPLDPRYFQTCRRQRLTGYGVAAGSFVVAFTDGIVQTGSTTVVLAAAGFLLLDAGRSVGKEVRSHWNDWKRARVTLHRNDATGSTQLDARE